MYQHFRGKGLKTDKFIQNQLWLQSGWSPKVDTSETGVWESTYHHAIPPAQQGSVVLHEVWARKMK